MANVASTTGKIILLNSTAALLTDSVRTSLHTSSYSPATTDEFMSGTTNEVSGTNYTSGYAGTGRIALGTPAVTATTTYAKFSSAAQVYTAVNSFTAAKMVIYRHITSDAASNIFVIIDGGFPVVANGGNITISPDGTSGWFYI